MLFQALQELDESSGVNALVLDVPGDELAFDVDSSCDCNCTESDLFLGDSDNSIMRRIPGFRLNLTFRENCLVQVEDVLPPVVGLQNSGKPFHPTAVLPGLLRGGQVYVYAQYALLYAMFFV